MPALEYSRAAAGILFRFKGMNTMQPVDGMLEGKVPVAVNLRAYLGDRVTPRLPQGASLVTPIGIAVNSLRRLNDTTPLGPPAGYSLVFGGVNGTLHVNNTQVKTGFSGKPMSLVSFRPDQSPQPWMYVGDSVLQVKVNSQGVVYFTGISEPVVAASVANSTTPPPALVSPIYYRYRYRSSVTGAKSNPSPPMRTPFALGSFAPQVTCTASLDPQVDTIDVFRFDGGLLDYTYVGSTPNSSGVFVDTLDDSAVAANEILEFDNFAPFPSIDIPHSGTVTINGTIVTWASGDQFDLNWAPGSIILIGGKPAQLYTRPSTTTQLEILDGNAVATTQAQRAGSGSNDAGGLIPTGTVNWTNPNNVTSTSSFADAVLSGSVAFSVALLTANSFTIPGGATILGIRVDYEAKSTVPSPSDNRIQVYVRKVSFGLAGNSTLFPVPSSVTSETAGGSTDLWGVTWTPADINDPNFGPAFGAVATTPGGTISVRNVRTTVYYQAGAGSPVSYQVSNATLLGQPLPAWWGPTDNAGFFFACGDPLRPGTLYWTKGNNPDSAPDTNQLEVTSPSEPLMNGCIVGGLGMVFSTEKAWLIYPNFAQATATVLGVQGQQFSLVESISERGLYARQGICTDGGGWVYFICKDGIRKSPAGSGSQSITDGDLYNLFPHEGIPQQSYVVQSTAGVIFTLSPPDYTKPDNMLLRFSQGYLYFDYVGLDNQAHTLVYDVAHDAWSVDIYENTATIHADNEGEASGTTGAQVGIGSLMGCIDGSVRAMTPVSSESVLNTMRILTQAYDNGDRRATKRFGDIFMEYSIPNLGSPYLFTISPYTDRYVNPLAVGQMVPNTLGLNTGRRETSICELGPVGNTGQGVYSKDIELDISIPVQAVGAQLFSWQPSLVPQPATTGARYTDWDDLGSSGAKFIQGAIIEADTGNVAKFFQAQSGDDLSLHQFAEVGLGVAFNGQSKKAFSFATPFVAHNLRLALDPAVPVVDWRLWGIEWIFVPYPELVNEWHSEGVSHGLPGWQHVKEINVAHLSTADLTLTLVRDFGSPISVTIPNSGGIQTKTLVQIPPPSKFKIVSYNITSTQPFRLWVSDLEVWVKEWNNSGPYRLIRPFGGASKMAAEI